MAHIPKEYLEQHIPDRLVEDLGLGISFESDAPQLIVTFGKFGDCYCYLLVLYLQSTKVHYILEEEKTTDVVYWLDCLRKINKALKSPTFHYLGDDQLTPSEFNWLKAEFEFTYNPLT